MGKSSRRLISFMFFYCWPASQLNWPKKDQCFPEQLMTLHPLAPCALVPSVSDCILFGVHMTVFILLTWPLLSLPTTWPCPPCSGRTHHTHVPSRLSLHVPTLSSSGNLKKRSLCSLYSTSTTLITCSSFLFTCVPDWSRCLVPISLQEMIW